MIIECFVDGAARGQGSKGATGDAACGVVIFKNRKKIAQFARGLGKRTNNEAEYEAVLHALLMCAMADWSDPIIYSDSAVVVNHIKGKWKCNSPDLLPLLESIRSIQKEFNFRVVQVDRSWVRVADTAANAFLDQLLDERSDTYNSSKVE